MLFRVKRFLVSPVKVLKLALRVKLFLATPPIGVIVSWFLLTELLRLELALEEAFLFFVSSIRSFTIWFRSYLVLEETVLRFMLSSLMRLLKLVFLHDD